MAAYNHEQNLTCETYFSVVSNVTEAAAICEKNDFSDLYTLQFYVAAWWYN